MINKILGYKSFQNEIKNAKYWIFLIFIFYCVGDVLTTYLAKFSPYVIYEANNFLASFEYFYIALIIMKLGFMTFFVVLTTVIFGLLCPIDKKYIYGYILSSRIALILGILICVNNIMVILTGWDLIYTVVTIKNGLLIFFLSL